MRKWRSIARHFENSARHYRRTANRVSGVRRPRRLRWPLVALVALVLALAIGYAVRALTSSDNPAVPAPHHSGCVATAAARSGCPDT